MAKKPAAISQAHLAAARAVDNLRRQLGIVVQEDSGKLAGACPVEGVTAGLLEALKALPGAKLSLLLASPRARQLGFAAKTSTLRLKAQNLSLDALQALADPLHDGKPIKPKMLPALTSQGLLMHMAKHASLLPALLIIEAKRFPKDWPQLATSDLAAYWCEPALDILPLVQAALPIKGAEDASITCFRERYGTSVHLALTFGQPQKEKAPLVRVHSSCVTGDILGSLRCDCGNQLALALEQLKAGGVLLYLHQEGRGIGIANKLRAYKLQEQGVDTYEANLMLGFAEDERDFSIAAAILKQLRLPKIRLLTNNPQKITALKKAGITIIERLPLAAKPGKHNHGYLAAKAKKSGHLF